MRALALLVALFIMVAGIAGVVTPDALFAVGRYVVAPAGLYAVAAVRVAVGIVLMLVAPISRTPRTLRVCGAAVLVAGLATPFFGVERAREILDWEAARGTALVRGAAVLVLVLGGLITSSVASVRRPS